MTFRLKKIHHLIRYFLLLGAGVFVGYLQRWNEDLTLLFIGPPLYLAYSLKKIIASYAGPLPPSQAVNHYAFLLPITLVYFGLIGFQLKQLYNERGFIRTLSLFALAGFLIYIHYMTWEYLLGFFTPDA